MRIVFRRTDAPPRGMISRIHRPDGVVVELPSYSGKHRVPHDLAHAVAERELRIAGGLFGSIASGAMFGNMRVVEGRPRHDAVARSKQILKANKRTLTVAELMAGVVHDAVEHGLPDPGRKARHDWGIVEERPFPWTDAQIAGAIAVLDDLSGRFTRARDLEFDWPHLVNRS